jgi:hypothetical protein
MQGRLNAAGILAVIGAGALLAGLFLDWFEPGISAWNAFEIVDLLLAAIALGVLLVALGASSERPRLVALAGWLPVAAFAAFALVVVSLINPPPAVGDGSLELGAWVSLAGTALLIVGAVLATTELSLVVTVRPRRHRGSASAVDEVAPPASDPGWEPPLEGSPPGQPIEDPHLEGAPFEEPLAEPPVEEPFDEPATDEEPIEPAEPTEPVDEIIEPAAADEETRALRRND